MRRAVTTIMVFVITSFGVGLADVAVAAPLGHTASPAAKTKALKLAVTA